MSAAEDSSTVSMKEMRCLGLLPCWVGSSVFSALS